MQNDYSNWCPDIFRGLYILKLNNNEIKVSPCSQSRPNFEKADSFDYNTSQSLEQIRNEIKTGQKPIECSQCWLSEHRGFTSRRQQSQKFFQILPSYDVELESIDFNTSRACNLACIMCGPYYSSLWAKELNVNDTELKNYGYSSSKENQIFNSVDLSKVKRVYFNGGEPLLNKNHHILLEKLKNYNVLSNCTISYNTNGTIFPDSKTLDYWKQAKLVKLLFSIDAVDKAYEYIRWPAKWSTVENNIRKFVDTMPSNVMFGVTVTVGIHNILELDKIWDFFKNNLYSNREGDLSDFNWQTAHGKFALTSLNKDIKEEFWQRCMHINAYTGLNDFVSSLPEDMCCLSWNQFINEIDQRRNLDWKQSLDLGKYF